MLEPHGFYKERIVETQTELSRVKQKALLISITRLVLFLLTIFLAYFFRDSNTLLFSTIIIGLVLFFVLVSVYTNQRNKKRYLELLIGINENELKALSGDFESFYSGEEYIDGAHAFSQDMDLFGKGSFFQALNRTETKTGEHLLAKDILMSNNTQRISDKQQAIKELSLLPKWRQEFSVNAALIDKQANPHTIVQWMKGVVGH